MIKNAGLKCRQGWAFGLGLERLAMVLFSIPDIRLFWSDDPRFSKQFKCGEIVKFKTYSKYPLCWKDVSFWLPDDIIELSDNDSGEVYIDPKTKKTFHSNDVYDVIRTCAGDIVEEVTLIDRFVNKKTNRVSHAYRIVYRHMDR